MKTFSVLITIALMLLGCQNDHDDPGSPQQPAVNYPPYPPQPVNPPPGATLHHNGGTRQYNTVTFSFEWYATDPEGDTLCYDLYYRGSKRTSNRRSNSYTVTLATYDESRQVDWYVVVKDSLHEVRGPKWMFTIIN